MTMGDVFGKLKKHISKEISRVPKNIERNLVRSLAPRKRKGVGRPHWSKKS